ncbi:MAG TPA: hypothetical protein VFG07_02120 [Thermoplasmata archaeon]|nr:hypothetical protein [Thermoplasmata archaeon]
MSIASPVEPPTAMVVAGEEETRVLLRGLLRLHHFRVLGEAEGGSGALDRLREAAPQVLVVDSQLAEGSADSLVPAVRRRFPAVRVVLVLHGGVPAPTDGPEGPDVVLRRPFRIQEFATAVSRGRPPA